MQAPERAGHQKAVIIITDGELNANLELAALGALDRVSSLGRVRAYRNSSKGNFQNLIYG